MDLPGFLADCITALGVRHVLTDPDLTAAHARDWTGRWEGAAAAVLRPGGTEEVAAVVTAARRRGVPLVPQGGNTGLVGGSVPHHGEVVVDLRRLDHLGEVDRVASQVTAGAGVTLAALDAHVASAALSFGVDLGARDLATVGGMIATNAGGTQVLRHGAMRAQVVGVEAVLGTGAVVRANLAGLVKDNTGYDLPGLLCGSEGTLGIVTAARLRLVRRPTTRLVALLGFDALDAALAAVPTLRTMPDIHALEVMLADGVSLVARHLGVAPPLEPLPPCILLVELAGWDGDALVEQLAPVLDELGSSLRGSALAQDERGCVRLWRWRDAHPQAAAALGTVHKADVTVPLRAVASYLPAVATVAAELEGGLTLLQYGHLGDGNIHVNVVGPFAAAEALIEAALALALDAGGSVSAEHGIGVAKLGWMEAQRGAVAVDAMRAIKRALDPDGVLNPGVLLPPTSPPP